jgi:hypothetical protein
VTKKLPVKASRKGSLSRKLAPSSPKKAASLERRSNLPSKSNKGATVSRASTPARSAHARPQAPRPKNEPMPLPMPTRHVAPPRPVLVAPARSMPPTLREVARKPVATAAALAPVVAAPAPAPVMPIAVPRPPVLPVDFSEAGIILAITYSIREGRRNEFFELVRELKPLLAGIGGLDCTVYEDRSRPNYFMEVFRFKDEAEFTAFDDKFHKDRKIAAIYTLLDDIVEAEKSDFKIFERRL